LHGLVFVVAVPDGLAVSERNLLSEFVHGFALVELAAD
jgi:hypothetical protein